MNRLHARDFKRIYIALLLDLFVSIVLPLLLLFMIAFLDTQMKAAGLTGDEVSFDAISQRPILRMIYAYYPVRFCASALCALLAVSGLDGIASSSPWLLHAQRWFNGCALMNAVAMAARVIRISFLNTDAPGVLLHLSFVAQAVTLSLLGAAEYTLLKGFGDVLESIGAQEQSLRAHRLSIWTGRLFFALAVSYFVFMADLSIEKLPFYLVLAVILIVVTVALLSFAVRSQAMYCARRTWQTLAEISDEVIS